MRDALLLEQRRQAQMVHREALPESLVAEGAAAARVVARLISFFHSNL